MMHPLVRDLYKRILVVSKDYPNSDYNHMKQLWKTALRDPINCPSWYQNTTASKSTNNNIEQNQANNSTDITSNVNDIDELYHAVHRGRLMVKEMIGIIQLNKYRRMKQQYTSHDNAAASSTTEHFIQRKLKESPRGSQEQMS
jgi:hypothetical protein